MSKTISWPARVTYIFIALALALSLAAVAVAVPKTDADPGLTKWTKVTTPTDSNETIIQGADIYDIAIGSDGDVIYAIGKMPEGRASPLDSTTIALWKSTDGGATWSDKTSKLLQANVKPTDALPAEFDYLTQVAVAPNNEDFVVVAGMSENYGSVHPMVVGSTDGATKFYTTYAEDTLAESEDIICMDISRGIEDVYNMALGTSAGKVWRYEAGTYWGGNWVEASTYTGWQASTKVTSVAFSPSWSADKTLLAISTNDTAKKTWLQTAKWGTTKGWGTAVDRASKVEFLVETESVEPISNVKTKFGLPTAYHGVTGMALPSDYHGRESSLRRVYAYVDVVANNVTAGGYLFRIDSTTLSIPCGPTGNPWFGSLAYHGDHDTGDAMLGMLGDDAPAAADFTDCCVGVQVWRTDEIDLCCPDWKGATKKPSGQAYALVAFTPDGDKAYATTAGEGKGLNPSDESAFSVSLDNGKCWNQLGLIDTDIDFISDMAASPDCSVTYLATMNTDEGEGNTDQICNCDSVWMKDDNATEYAGVWQRIYHKTLLGHGLLRLSPEHDDGDVVYWGAMDTSALYWAESKGICKWSTKDAPTISIQDFVLADDDTLYVINDSDDLVKWTEAKGDWSSAVDHKAVEGHTIAALGDYVLVGGKTGSVGYSDDAGDSFSRLGDKAELTGNVHVALDTYFTDNDTVYAAVSGGNGDNGIWRWVVDDSTSWSDLYATPSTFQLTGAGSETDAIDLDYYGIVTELSQDGNPKTKAANGGVLYAVYRGVTIDDATFSGVARCLTPAQETCCGQLSWDYLFCKLSEDAEDFSLQPSALKICGCLTADSNSNLFAIDNQNYYVDYTISEGAKFITSAQGRLWTYEDCFAKAGITLESVADGVTIASDPCECYNEKFVLEWERLCNACEYDLQISLDDDFTQIMLDTDNLCYGYLGVAADTKGQYAAGPGGFYDPPKNETPTVLIWEGAIDCNTTYYWRVRSRYAETPEAIRSFWSDTWSFTVEAGPTVAIDLTAPDYGATKVAITSIGFTWTSVADATSYDFVLSANADLSSPVATKTGLTGTAYTFTGTLDYDTTYFWQVTAMKDGNVFSVSDVSTFTTTPTAVFTCPQCGLTFPTEAAFKAHIAEAHPPVEPVTPAWVWVVIGLGAVLVITIIVLIFRTRRV